MKSHEILNNPFLNKGTAFTMEERKELGLIVFFLHMFKPSKNKLNKLTNISCANHQTLKNVFS